MFPDTRSGIQSSRVTFRVNWPSLSWYLKEASLAKQYSPPAAAPWRVQPRPMGEESGADVAAAIRAARGLARGRRETFAEAHLTEVIGAAHRQDPPDLLRRIAVHEAGHPILASCLDHPAPVRIAFTADGAEPTYAATANPGTRAARDGRLAAKMAGRAAELLMLGEIAEGSGGSAMSDLAQATVLALREELSFGLGATGAIWFDEMLLGEQFRETELRFAVDVVASTADEWDDRLKQMFGGMTYQEVLKSQAEGRPPPVQPGAGPGLYLCPTGRYAPPHRPQPPTDRR